MTSRGGEWREGASKGPCGGGCPKNAPVGCHAVPRIPRLMGQLYNHNWRECSACLAASSHGSIHRQQSEKYSIFRAAIGQEILGSARIIGKTVKKSMFLVSSLVKGFCGKHLLVRSTPPPHTQAV
jgi:hypothetical protein